MSLNIVEYVQKWTIVEVDMLWYFEKQNGIFTYT